MLAMLYARALPLKPRPQRPSHTWDADWKATAESSFSTFKDAWE